MAEREVVSAIDELLHHISEERGIPAADRVTLGDVYHLYNTNVQTLILHILLPVIRRLRKRIVENDYHFFASEAFITAVARAVDDCCRDAIEKNVMQHDKLKLVQPNILPILSTVRYAASQYLVGDVILYEYIQEKLLFVVTSLCASKS
ncbi:MAG: hypothetical protein WC483_02140 [Candidatus Paceibacterota bacterium]